jgi:hypothetical protein
MRSLVLRPLLTRLSVCRGSSRLQQTTKLIGGGVWPSYLGAPAFHGATGQDRDVDKSELLGSGRVARACAGRGRCRAGAFTVLFGVSPLCWCR